MNFRMEGFVRMVHTANVFQRVSLAGFIRGYFWTQGSNGREGQSIVFDKFPGDSLRF